MCSKDPINSTGRQIDHITRLMCAKDHILCASTIADARSIAVLHVPDRCLKCSHELNRINENNQSGTLSI